jgi:hypothetical protein
MLIGQLDTILVTASTTGYLNAWIDYDGNGTWADQGEQIYTDQMLVAGTNKLAITVPGNAVEISTYARFRFSSLAGLSYTGEAPDGEVEDYMVVLDDQTSVYSAEASGIDLRVFPNPCSSAVRLRLTNNDYRLTISDLYTISGKKIRELINEVLPAGEHEVELNVNDLPNGLYMIRVRSGNRVEYKKLLVVH